MDQRPYRFQKDLYTFISVKMHQIGQPRTVLKSLESEEFKTVLDCPIWCIFDQDICIKIFLKSVGLPVRFIFSLYILLQPVSNNTFYLLPSIWPQLFLFYLDCFLLLLFLELLFSRSKSKSYFQHYNFYSKRKIVTWVESWTFSLDFLFMFAPLTFSLLPLNCGLLVEPNLSLKNAKTCKDSHEVFLH